MKPKISLVYKTIPCLFMMGCPWQTKPTSSQNPLSQRNLAVCPNPLDNIKKQHGQTITREIVNRMFASYDEKRLLTDPNQELTAIYQVDHNYLLKVFDENLLRDRIAICPTSEAYSTPNLPNLKATYQSLMQRKQSNLDLPIVDIYAIFDIDVQGCLSSKLFDEPCGEQNQDGAPLTGVVMSKPHLYDDIPQDNFRETIPDYDITLLCLNAKGIFPDETKPANTGYILTDEIPLYAINGKYYRVANPAKENGIFKQTVWFDFDAWAIKDPLPKEKLKAKVDQLTKQGVIQEVHPYLGCIV